MSSPSDASTSDLLLGALADLLATHPDCVEALDAIQSEVCEIVQLIAQAEFSLQMHGALLPEAVEALRLSCLDDARRRANQLRRFLKCAAQWTRENSGSQAITLACH